MPMIGGIIPKWEDFTLTVDGSGRICYNTSGHVGIGTVNADSLRICTHQIYKDRVINRLSSEGKLDNKAIKTSSGLKMRMEDKEKWIKTFKSEGIVDPVLHRILIKEIEQTADGGIMPTYKLIKDLQTEKDTAKEETPF